MRSLIFIACVILSRSAFAEIVLDARMHHLRSGEKREWADFPEKAESSQLSIKFNNRRNDAEQTLWLRQEDVKQRWKVELNGKRIGRLAQDENNMWLALPIGTGTLKDGDNILTIDVERARASDDIRVGSVRIDRQPVDSAIGSASLSVKVTDERSGKAIPCRITLVDQNDALIPLATKSNDRLAVRPGVIYTIDGSAALRIPSGKYTIHAGRGFEYSIDTKTFAIAPGKNADVALQIKREVSTPGLVACDTHVHTVTYSRHGDCTLTERMITLAGEGIELPIATDHNIHIDYRNEAARIGADKHFTPVIGNEYTTRFGHFNIFPIKDNTKPPNHMLKTWPTIFDAIDKTDGVKIAILNHGRDIHGGFRPFGPSRFNALIGRHLNGKELQVNAMELINSGATQTSVMRLYYDWFALLNRGKNIAGIGSSDSHDVNRYIVGQGRTYIQCDDDDPSKIDVSKAVQSLVAGQVHVSFGLLTDLKVAQAGDKLEATITVKGPHWTKAEYATLFVNGTAVHTTKIKDGNKSPLKWTGTVAIDRPNHDIFLVAIAHGPGVAKSYWRIARPYQPTSPVWKPYVFGSTPPVWIDADGNGKRDSALDYAKGLVKRNSKNFEQLVKDMNDYHFIIAAHVFDLLTQDGTSLDDPKLKAALKHKSHSVTDGLMAYKQSLAETAATQK